MADFTSDSVEAAWAIHWPAVPLSSPSRNVALAMSAPHVRKASPASPSHCTWATCPLSSSPNNVINAAAEASRAAINAVRSTSACSTIAHSSSCVFDSKSDAMIRPLAGFGRIGLTEPDDGDGDGDGDSDPDDPGDAVIRIPPPRAPVTRPLSQTTDGL
ncbi:hypothetical protein [Streptomyces griseocarneus]|uniref:hypothetical protein n=1 Tax=Streptomyces griseocarneus TaxID=51201 RepID=UPI00167C687A|nr:hypothetical protein [Streptomyces griseocarneus]MBZ6473969.1 hypothetical protein [Streptomyces griseocarneus]